MQSESINLIPAKVCGSPYHIWLELEDTTQLQIPYEHQQKLLDYLNCRIMFGINPEFIEVGKDDEQLNICLGKLMAVEEGKVQFAIAEHPVIARTHAQQIEGTSIGQKIKFNIDTYFGHVFDPDTQLNLTI